MSSSRQIADDATIADLLRTNPSEGFAELLRKDGEKIAGWLKRKLVGFDLEVEEVINEAYIQARKYSHTYDATKSKPKTWFFHIARRAAFKMAIKEKRYRLNHKVMASDPPYDPEDEEKLDELVQKLYDAVEELPENQHAIVSQLLSGASLGEIAASLGKTPSNVGVSKLKAERNLAKIMSRPKA